jgi:hypothetical protein
VDFIAIFFHLFLPQDILETKIIVTNLQADSNFLRGPYYHVDSDDLETSTLGLEFKVKSRHFRKGDMKLKCLATIASVYWRSNEESVEGEKPREAVMESRGTAPPSKSRAERVEGQILNATFQLDGASRCPASH